jgi:hypothetical protein
MPTKRLIKLVSKYVAVANKMTLDVAYFV